MFSKPESSSASRIAPTCPSIIPLGPTVSIFGERTPLQLTDAPIGVFIILACSAMGVYGIVLAGWASGSTYPLLGGLRSAAQMVSYEIPLTLSIVGAVVLVGRSRQLSRS